MVRAGQIRSHKARSSVYWAPSLEGLASERILEALNEIPLTQTDLKSKLRSLLIGWPQTKRDEMLARLMKEKRVYKVPPLTGKAYLLSARDEIVIRKRKLFFPNTEVNWRQSDSLIAASPDPAREINRRL